MASNKELIGKIEVLAKELKLDISTEDLNNEKLAALVSDLKAKKKDADNVTAADTAPTVTDTDTDAELEEFEEMPQYTVTKGCITTMSGIKAEGDEIKASDISGGQESLESLVSRGHVTDNHK